MPRIVKQNEDQYRITIPLALVRALGIQHGDKFDFRITGRGNLELVKTRVNILAKHRDYILS